ncbi:hypothetical protein PGB90_004591 [Kerria lacca]
MDRDSEEHEELARTNKNQNENGAESEEDTDTDPHAILLRKINELTQSSREDTTAELKLEELRRIYEMNNNNNGHTPHIPEAHRTPPCTSNITTPTYSTFPPHFANDRDRLLQYHLSNYLTNSSYQQQYSPNPLPNISTVQSSIMQPTTSFQSVPSPRVPSPHHQFQRKQNSPQSYNRSPTNFQSPPPAHIKRSASVCSKQSREESASPVHQSSWSFEEQFKQLYDIDRDDVQRKEFLDDLFSFMQKHETPVTRLPIMAKSVLDLYELYRLVINRGGLVDVINKKLWQEVIKGLNLPSSITSAAFTLRTQYMKFLYAYECHKMNLSTRQELEMAIEGNKREGRRTSYYGDIQMRSPNSNGPNNGHSQSNSIHHGQSQMGPVSLVTTSTPNSVSNRVHLNGHSNQFSNHTGDTTIPNVHGLSSLVLQGTPLPVSPESRILEYIKLMNTTRFFNNTANSGNGTSPDVQDTSNLNMDVAHLTLWNLYNSGVKTPLSQPPVLPFQPPRPQSENSNIEAPLDLGKNRKEEPIHSEDVRASKRERDEEDHESDDTETSSDEGDIELPINSSQGSKNTDVPPPVVVRMKINGRKYRGVLHPKLRN